jgi:hypothetical protein
MPSHSRASIITAVLLTLLVVITIVGVGLGYLVSKAKSTEKDLNNQITELKKQVATATSISASATGGAIIYNHPEMKYSLKLLPGYIGVDKYDCEGVCGSNLMIAQKIVDGSYSDSSVSLRYLKSDNTLDKEIADYKIHDGGDIIKESDIKINGITAKKFEIGGMAQGFDYLAVSNGYSLKITQYPSGPENQKVIDKILSTFQFTK